MHHCIHPTTTPDGFDDQDLDRIRDRVSRFLQGRAFHLGEPFDEWFGRCCLHWARQHQKYDPSKGASRSTFLHKVIDTYLLQTARDLQADKRQTEARAVFLFEPLADGSTTTLADALTSANDTAEEVEREELRSAVRQVMEHLTPLQQQLAAGLMAEQTMSEIAAELGKGRGTLYGEVPKIAKAFEDAGLHDLLH